MVAQHGQQAGQGVVADDDLRLEVVARDDVADGAEGGRLDGGRRVHEELDQALAHAGLDDSLDLLVGAVRQVGERPARVRQHLLVGGVDQLRIRRREEREKVSIVETESDARFG